MFNMSCNALAIQMIIFALFQADAAVDRITAAIEAFAAAACAAVKAINSDFPCKSFLQVQLAFCKSQRFSNSHQHLISNSHQHLIQAHPPFLNVLSSAADIIFDCLI